MPAPCTKRSRSRREAPATPTTAAIDDGIAPRRSFVRLGVVERFRQWHGRGLSLIFRPCKERQVAEVAKALYRRTDELAVLLARALTRRSCSSPLMFGCRRRALPQIACTPTDREQIGPTTTADA